VTSRKQERLALLADAAQPGEVSGGPPGSPAWQARSRGARIDLRPVYHRKEEWIRAHVILCWLALLLARIAENACDSTWSAIRRELDRIAVGTFAGPAGTFRQRTEISQDQQDILTPARHRPAPEDLPAHPSRNPLTSGNTRPRYTPSS
jgi:hypothetical protein